MSDGPLTISPPSLSLGDVGSATVLVVDDNRLSASQVTKLVEHSGHSVLVAHTWSEAVQIFDNRSVDLVLMDAMMPNVDGFKLTRILRDRSKSYVPIVFLTGLTDQSARLRGIEAGADDLLTKPIDDLELRIRLLAMLRIRRLTKALENKSAMLAQLAKVDGLTGLQNRRMLDERLPREVERARRYQRELSLLMMDVDHFKMVNDTFGHDAGDRVLVCLGEVMRECVRNVDQAYRYGGEELVILAPETDEDASLVIAERVRSEFQVRSNEVSPAGPQTLSVGIASLSAMPSDATAVDLQAAADAAMYKAKRSGRDCVCVHARE